MSLVSFIGVQKINVQWGNLGRFAELHVKQLELSNQLKLTKKCQIKRIKNGGGNIVIKYKKVYEKNSTQELG